MICSRTTTGPCAKSAPLGLLTKTALPRVLSLCSVLALSTTAQAQPTRAAEATGAPQAPVEEVPAAPAYAPRLSSPEERLALSNELGEVESRLAYMSYEQRDGRIAGPIAMLASGYGTALVAMGVALVSFAAAEDVEHWDVGDDWSDHLDTNDDGSIDADDERDFRRMARGFGVLSGVGAAVGVAGSVFLAKRMRVRRLHAPEVRALQRRRFELRRQLEYGASFSARGLQFGLQGRF